MKEPDTCRICCKLIEWEEHLYNAITQSLFASYSDTHYARSCKHCNRQWRSPLLIMCIEREQSETSYLHFYGSFVLFIPQRHWQSWIFQWTKLVTKKQGIWRMHYKCTQWEGLQCKWIAHWSLLFHIGTYNARSRIEWSHRSRSTIFGRGITSEYSERISVLFASSFTLSISPRHLQH